MHEHHSTLPHTIARNNLSGDAARHDAWLSRRRHRRFEAVLWRCDGCSQKNKNGVLQLSPSPIYRFYPLLRTWIQIHAKRSQQIRKQFTFHYCVMFAHWIRTGNCIVKHFRTSVHVYIHITFAITVFLWGDSREKLIRTQHWTDTSHNLGLIGYGTYPCRSRARHRML